MKESVVITKEADAKKDFSPTRSVNSIHRVQDEPERQLGSLRSVINNIRRNGGKPSVESIATQMSGMPTGARAPALLALQQTHGNRYVQRVVAGIPAKLTVGQPGDKYEQEADRVADAVMRMSEPQAPQQAEEEKKEEEETLLAKGTSSNISEVTSDLEFPIQSLIGGGQPLPKFARAFFEPRFGQNFSQVRVHTDTRAAESARAVNARAFAVGRDVVFGAGQYAPGTSEGRKLMAHELTHVMQQQGGASISRKDVGTAENAAPIEKPEPAPKTTEPTITYWSTADSSTVSTYALGVIKDVLKAAGETKAEISSTTRTAADQARVMYNNIVLKSVESQKRLYGPSGDKVIEVYVKLKKEGKNEAQIKAAMEAKIVEVGKKNVSRHCGDPTKLQVIDVAPSSIANKAKFVEEAEKDTRVSKFLKPPDDPGYHFEIPPK